MYGNHGTGLPADLRATAEKLLQEYDIYHIYI